MRKHPRVANRPAVEQCLCNAIIGYVCSIHRGESAKKSANNELTNDDLAHSEPDRYALTRPWNPDDLPEHLRGYGHHTGWSANINGEWILPEEDKEGEFMRAVNQIFEVT